MSLPRTSSCQLTARAAHRLAISIDCYGAGYATKHGHAVAVGRCTAADANAGLPGGTAERHRDGAACDCWTIERVRAGAAVHADVDWVDDVAVDR